MKTFAGSLLKREPTEIMVGRSPYGSSIGAGRRAYRGAAGAQGQLHAEELRLHMIAQPIDWTGLATCSVGHARKKSCPVYKFVTNIVAVPEAVAERSVSYKRVVERDTTFNPAQQD